MKALIKKHTGAVEVRKDGKFYIAYFPNKDIKGWMDYKKITPEEQREIKIKELGI